MASNTILLRATAPAQAFSFSEFLLNIARWWCDTFHASHHVPHVEPLEDGSVRRHVLCSVCLRNKLDVLPVLGKPVASSKQVSR
jgi:hypothetical protein